VENISLPLTEEIVGKRSVILAVSVDVSECVLVNSLLPASCASQKLLSPKAAMGIPILRPRCPTKFLALVVRAEKYIELVPIPMRKKEIRKNGNGRRWVKDWAARR
jgi:hypothetical protein